MGTNYYAEANHCTHCNRSDVIHIGKASAGWRFLLHVTDELPDYAAWSPVLREAKITDEYGRSVTADELAAVIAMKQCGMRHHEATDCVTHDSLKGEFS